MTVTLTVLFSWHGKVFSVSSNTGGLWIVGSHVPFGLCRGSAGGHWPKRWFFTGQGATVEDVEYSSQPPYRHHHPGRRICHTEHEPFLLERGQVVLWWEIASGSRKAKTDSRIVMKIHPVTITVKWSEPRGCTGAQLQCHSRSPHVSC